MVGRKGAEILSLKINLIEASFPSARSIFSSLSLSLYLNAAQSHSFLVWAPFELYVCVWWLPLPHETKGPPKPTGGQQNGRPRRGLVRGAAIERSIGGISRKRPIQTSVCVCVCLSLPLSAFNFLAQMNLSRSLARLLALCVGVDPVDKN